MRIRLAAVAGALLGLTLSACSSSPSRPPDVPTASVPATATAMPRMEPTDGAEFTSSQYGYSVRMPPAWTAAPATERWDGGDIDHTAAYADRFTDPEGNVFFVLGEASGASAAEYADAHAAWLEENRGCPAPTARTTTVIDGEPAVRLAIHCPDGVFGPTLVSKVIVMHAGTALAITSFSPDTGADDFAPLDALAASLHWSADT